MVKIIVQLENVEDIKDFVRTVAKYEHTAVDISCGHHYFDGKSLIGLLTVEPGSKLQCLVYGDTDESDLLINDLFKYTDTYREESKRLERLAV